MRQRGKQSGQALITLLVFVIISITITSAAVIIIVVNSRAASRFQEGTRVYYVAEGGMENALLRLLRNPNYAGEVLTIDDGTATITVTGTNPKTVVSVGKIGSYLRKIQAQVTSTNGSYTVSAWKEIL